MGTHALVVFEENTSQGIVRYLVCYFQFDGYLTGVGLDLVEFLKSCVIVNGYSDQDEAKCKAENKILCNRFGCLVAQYVANNKNGPGNFYVFPVTHRSMYEYKYIVTFDEDQDEKNHFAISVNDSEQMNLEEFEDFCKKKEPEDELGEPKIEESKDTKDQKIL